MKQTKQTPKSIKPAHCAAHLPVLTAENVADTIVSRTLYHALSMRRAGGSVTEAKFVAWLCRQVDVSMIDEVGNIYVDTRTRPEHKTMFTSHTDTVHYRGGDNVIRLDATDPNNIKWRASEGACLGADDGAGCALMLHMIGQGVPGLYVFFRGEETGGTGSRYLAASFQEAIEGIEHCISLDRAGYSDVITHQAGERCCSDMFAHTLAAALTTADFSLAFLPDSTGVFTDSANLTGVISECTNLSVGYAAQHGDGEWVNVSFLERLADQLCKVDWASLPAQRDTRYEEYISVFAQPYLNTGGHMSPQAAFTRLNKAQADQVDNLVDALFDAADGYHLDLYNIVDKWAGDATDAPTRANAQTLSYMKADELQDYAFALETGEMSYDDVLSALAQ